MGVSSKVSESTTALSEATECLKREIAEIPEGFKALERQVEETQDIIKKEFAEFPAKTGSAVTPDENVLSKLKTTVR